MSVRFRFRRLWPSGITGRLIAIFAVAIALTIGVSELVEWHHDSHWEEMDLHAQDRQRMIAIASFLQSSKDLTDGKLQASTQWTIIRVKTELSPPGRIAAAYDKLRQISTGTRPSLNCAIFGATPAKQSAILARLSARKNGAMAQSATIGAASARSPRAMVANHNAPIWRR